MELDFIAITRKKLMEDQNIRRQIEQRAFELYLDRGCIDGGHQEDWTKAEEEILTPLLRKTLHLPRAEEFGKVPSEIGLDHAARDLSGKSSRTLKHQKEGPSRPKTSTKSTTAHRSADVPAKSAKTSPTKLSKRKEPVAKAKAAQPKATEKNQMKPKVRKTRAKPAASFPENSL